MNPWKRKGLFYYATLTVYGNAVVRGTVKKKLDFVSYHLIMWIHGESKLRAMALRSFFEDDFDKE